MEARETTFRRLIQGDNQFQIPLYQRTYSWDRNDLQRLWDDLTEQAAFFAEPTAPAAESPGAPNGHFLGSLVLDPRPPLPDTVQRWIVIDGQQRLTTLMLLACALRDHVQRFDARRAGFIHRRYLVNEEDHEGLDFYRLLPTQADRPSFLACVESQPTAGGDDSVGAAYRFFKSALTAYDPVGSWETVQRIDQALQHRLTIVTITAGPGDNVFRIFESLNNTGKPLSQADLLRNFVFMQLPNLSQQVYDRQWLPMQAELGPDRLTTLAWLDLILQGHVRVTSGEVYQGQKRRIDRIVAARGEVGVRDDVARLRRLGRLLLRVFEPSQGPHDGVEGVLTRLVEWGGEAHHPPALHVLDQMDQGVIDAAEAAETLGYVESFLVRRMICREPSHSVSRILASIPSALESGYPLPEAVRRYLSGPRRGWPRDKDMHEAIRTQPFYQQGSSRHRAFVLRRLEESYAAPEPVDFTRAWASIEHVLPQRPGPEWMGMLGEDAEDDEAPQDLHEALVHTLGNLTLTGENIRLSNHPYERKQQILDESALRMNREIAAAHRWGRPEILARADRLADRAVAIWPRPVTEEVGSSNERIEWALLRTVLAALPAGRWTTYQRLAAVTGVGSPQSVGSYLARRSDVPNGHRVLRADGTSSPEFAWLDGRSESQQEVLEREGVRFHGGVADPEQILSYADLAAIAGLEEQGEATETQPGHEDSTETRSSRFQALLRSNQPEIADDLLGLLEKWEASGGWLGYGSAEETSCAPMLREGTGAQGMAWPVTIYPRTGVVEVVFGYLARREPFTRPELLRELRDRLNGLPGVVLSVPDEELSRRRPSFPISLLRGGGLTQFSEILEWFRQQSL